MRALKLRKCGAYGHVRWLHQRTCQHCLCSLSLPSSLSSLIVLARSASAYLAACKCCFVILMPHTLSCRRCTLSFPLSDYVGAVGRPVKTCATCRKASIPAVPPSPRVRTASSHRSRSRSPSPPRPRGAHRPSDDFARVSSLPALEDRLGRLSRLFQRVDQRLDEILLSIGQWAPKTSGTPLGPPGQPPASANAQLLPIAGESISALPPTTRFFPWLSPEVVDLVARDQLKPEHLVKLRNPESRVSKELS